MPPSLPLTRRAFIRWAGLASGKFSDTFQREMSLYLLNESTLDAFMAAAYQAALDALPDVVERNAAQYSTDGTWDLTRWPCAPAVQGM